MQQLDFLTPNHYLYEKIEKLEHSLDKRTRAIFSLLNEVQDQIMQIKEHHKNLALKDACPENSA